MYLVAKHSRDQITVALSGAGGDELYAGYPRYRAMQLARRFNWVPPLLWRLGDRSLQVFRDNGSTPLLRRARQFFSGMPLRGLEQFSHWTYFLGSDEKVRLLTNGNGSQAQWKSSERVLRRVFDNSPLADADNRLLHVDIRTFLLDNLLEYTDKMSMAVSLESRVPILDQDFVEFSLNVPFNHKLRGGRTKVLLRDAFDRFLPREARTAPKKGFNAPLSQWMRSTFDEYFEASQQQRHPLKEILGEDIGRTWQEERVLNWPYIQQLRQQHREGRADYSYELFSILVFDLWWRKYVSQTVQRCCANRNP
jgi:asparagine synthase (glutamine-hydrolysing)